MLQKLVGAPELSRKLYKEEGWQLVLLIRDYQNFYIFFDKWRNSEKLKELEALRIVHFLLDSLQNSPLHYRLSEIIKLYGYGQPTKILKIIKPIIGPTLEDVIYSILVKIKTKTLEFQKGMSGSYKVKDPNEFFEEFNIGFSEKAKSFIPSYKTSLSIKFQSLYIQENSPEGRNRIFGMMVTSQNTLIETWQDFLPEQDQFIDVRRLTLADINLSGFNLRRLRFENNHTNQVDLRGVSCRPDQFITVYGLAQQKIDDKLADQIFSTKMNYVKEKLSNANELIQYTISMLEALEQFRHLTCRGEMPSFVNISEAALCTVANLALQSFYINTLPDEHLGSHGNISSGKTELEAMPLSDIKELLIALLKHRNFILPPDVVAFNQQQKVVLLFEAISFIGDVLTELTVIYRDLPEKYASDVAILLNNVTEQYSDLKYKKHARISSYQQELINNLLICLNDPPDVQLSMTPEQRVEAALNTAKDRPYLSIDIRSFDIKSLPLKDSMQIEGVNLLITPDQESRLPVTWQMQRYSSVLAAISDGDVDKLGLLFKNNTTLDINHRDEAGRTPLMKASVENKPQVVRYLLQNGADCRVPTQNGWTIFEGVARLGLVEVAEVLLEFGATPDFCSLIHLGRPVLEIERLASLFENANEVDYDGQTPLHIAVKCKHTHLVPWLVKRGGSLEAVNRQKQTPLHLAVSVDETIAEELLKFGSVVTLPILRAACENKRDKLVREMRPKVKQLDLYTAMYLNETETIQSIVNTNVNGVQLDGYTPLVLACSLGKVDCVQWLIEEKGADVNLVCKFATPGMYAIQNKQIEVIRLLITMGISIIESVKGLPPLLFYAVSEGELEIVKVMFTAGKLNRNCKINANLIYMERTLLLVAAYKGHLKIVELLLDAGADPSLTDNEGNTPLHLAAKEGHSIVVLVLTQAMLSRPNSRGKSAANLASEGQHRQIAELLTPQSQYEQHVSIMSGNEGIPDITAGIYRLFSHKLKKDKKVVREPIEMRQDIESENTNVSTLK